jgi:tripartite-type tricarboxylate transporter receptor subunit TctC
VDVVHVPYKGSDGARVGILGGQVQMMFDAITTMAPNVRAGKLKGFGTSGRARSSVLPDVPTVAEAGVPGYEATIWLGVMAPAGTPKIIDRQRRDLKVTGRGSEGSLSKRAPPPLHDPGAVRWCLRGDIAKWAKVIAQAGIKLD